MSNDSIELIEAWESLRGSIEDRDEVMRKRGRAEAFRAAIEACNAELDHVASQRIFNSEAGMVAERLKRHFRKLAESGGVQSTNRKETKCPTEE